MSALTIKQRLYVAFSFLLFLSVVIFAVGRVGMGHAEDAVNDLIKDDVTIFEILGEIRESNLEHRIYWREVLSAAKGLTIFANADSISKVNAIEDKLTGLMRDVNRMAPSLDDEDKQEIKTLDASLTKMLNASRELKRQVGKDGMDDAAKEQKVAADSTAQAMETIAAAAEENDAALAQVEDAVHTVAGIASNLQSFVATFKV